MQEVQILKPDATKRAAVEELLSAEDTYTPAAPGACATLEGSKEYLRGQCHIADTSLVKQAAKGNVQAAIAVREGAHGKVTGDTTQVNVQVNVASKLEWV